MDKMKSIADQLREKMAKPAEITGETAGGGKEDAQKKAARKAEKIIESTILKALIAYDTSDNRNMVHVRLDKQTVSLLNKFKMATGVDVTKFVAFSVRHFLDTYPEIKLIIKQFIQNTEL